ncbi:hypothetical protein N181_22290 [Sinorhizobium fredii USDA 205]|nr:hypothetical protein SF83666_b49550 [Sinorhizobium fredii CCBAU 83666]KSV86209.1 hypothetical protein N181_22290 [Sinorhizobium fredii USDA 205]GEC33704.1 hypothetical protein EFR01_38750 [Sinorhizobium fredii]GLS06763.1 hypothetical protein GCM10007864_03880 [Sinorhizobium fredii]
MKVSRSTAGFCASAALISFIRPTRQLLDIFGDDPAWLNLKAGGLDFLNLILGDLPSGWRR